MNEPYQVLFVIQQDFRYLKKNYKTTFFNDVFFSNY